MSYKEKITSKDNVNFKHYKKLLVKKYRDKTGEFLVHGRHLVEEAMKVPGLLQTILTIDSNEEGILLTHELIRMLSSSGAKYDIIGVCKRLDNQFVLPTSNNILVLDGIQDPTNLGALLRSALAFGYNQVYISNDSADIFHEKTIRASQGALFNLEINRKDLVDIFEELNENNYKIIATDLSGEKAEVINFKKKALILGNEGAGISQLSKKNANILVTIPMNKKVESLNVSVAGGILMYLLR